MNVKIHIKKQGFTLVELLLVLVIAGVILSFALPAYTQVKINNTLATSINDFNLALLVSRSEATQRNRNVTLCKSTNPTESDPDCSTSNAVYWNQGWVVFIDTNNNGATDVGETIIRVGNPLETGYVLKATSGMANKVVYSSTGEVSATGGFVLCKDANTDYARVIRISTSGRIKIQDRSTAVSTCAPS